MVILLLTLTYAHTIRLSFFPPAARIASPDDHSAVLWSIND